jgi:hypothetical protein
MDAGASLWAWRSCAIIILGRQRYFRKKKMKSNWVKKKERKMGSISSRQQESSELWTFILSIPHPREFIGKLKENAIIFKIEKRHSFLKER